MLQTLLDKYKFLLMTLFILLVAGWAFFYHSGSQGDSKESVELYPQAVPQESPSVAEQTEESVNKDIFVDVKGAVKKPGIYKAVHSERVNDLIIRAGGFTAEAHEDGVNLAQKVTDEMVIYIPEEGEAGAAGDTIASYVQPEESQLNINKAAEQDFDDLPGIGPAKAKAIIDYRTENGPFKTVEELKEVPGIGEATFERLKENITAD
jgi:competence protein ComEA